MQLNKRMGERGNAFIFVLLGVALFAALAITIARGMRSQTTTTLSERDAELAATELLSYAQKLARGVDRVRRKNCSENDISFENGVEAGYTNAGAPGDNSCHIFDPRGGAVSWKSPPSGANDGSEWLFTGESCIANIGIGAAGCEGDSVSNEELIAILPSVDSTLCQTINDKLGISGIPVNAGTHSTVKFQGTFQDGSVINLGSSNNAACFVKTSVHYFYSVILVR